MNKMAESLQAKGYKVVNYDYPETQREFIKKNSEMNGLNNIDQDLRSFIFKKFKKLYYSKCYDFQCPLYLKYFQRTA